MLTSQLFEKIKSEAKTALRFEQRSCLRSRFNKNDCRVCLNECQAGALELDYRTLSFDSEKCTGCMRCEAVCPNDAFSADLDMLKLLKNIQALKMVVLSCRKKEQSAPHQRIYCIGAFSDSLLAAMNSLGNGKIFLDTTECKSCINGHCLEKIKLSLDRLRVKKSTSDKTLRIILVPDETPFPEVDSKISRRFFLKGTGRAITEFGIETISKTIQNNDTQKQGSTKGPTKNSVMLQFAFDKTADEEEKENLKSFFYNVQADEKCNLCPVCSGMCPTGALKRISDGGEKHLVFKSSDCSGCGLCRDFCKKQALSINRGFVGNIKKLRQLK